jgi:hypothetical protein
MVQSYTPNLPGSSGLIVIGTPSPNNIMAEHILGSFTYESIKFDNGHFSKHIFLYLHNSII